MSVDVKYTTSAKASGGGRNGIAGLENGQLTVTMASPKELGGSGLGHNPEELFATGYAACYLGAMRFAASSEKLGAVPDSATVKAEVGIGPRSDGGFGLKVKLVVSLPGLERSVAEKIVERGHFICPYSTRQRAISRS
jgi:osmotically inducible protein OsmC